MAKSFIVEGARKTDGTEQRLVIEADDSEQAEQIGNVRGLFVSSVKLASYRSVHQSEVVPKIKNAGYGPVAVPDGKALAEPRRRVPLVMVVPPG
jgi:hypothetical protein